MNYKEIFNEPGLQKKKKPVCWIKWSNALSKYGLSRKTVAHTIVCFM